MNIHEYLNQTEEKPLENIVENGGYTSIFRKIACIGDSLSSGEFQIINPRDNKAMGIDDYEHSWGKYLGRMAGSEIYNFSRGGMTAKEYAVSFSNEMGLYRSSLAADAYVIALGFNDLLNKNMTVGSVDDINREKPEDHTDSFAGYLGEIILKYRKISPGAKFFLVTIPHSPRAEVQLKAVADHRKLMYDLADFFDNTYVLDMNKYAPEFGSEFREKYMMRGHMTATGYRLFAVMVGSYIDYIVRKDPREFKYVGLSGYEYVKE